MFQIPFAAVIFTPQRNNRNTGMVNHGQHNYSWCLTGTLLHRWPELSKILGETSSRKAPLRLFWRASNVVLLKTRRWPVQRTFIPPKPPRSFSALVAWSVPVCEGHSLLRLTKNLSSHCRPLDKACLRQAPIALAESKQDQARCQSWQSFSDLCFHTRVR